MRIGYLIGALNPGGSERQLSVLAAGMARRGHDVEVLAYDGSGEFDHVVERDGGTVRRASGRGKLSKLSLVRTWLRTFRPSVVHGFMKRASSLAILANVPRRCSVIASDFSTATYARHKPILWAALALFHFADRVVTQTEVNRRSLGRLAPMLKKKLVVVRNGVDLERFSPRPRPAADPFRFLCVGAVFDVKNPVGVVEAVRLLRERASRPCRVDWVGRLERGVSGGVSPAFRRATERIRQYRLGDIISFKGETNAIEAEYSASDALLHASLQEGIPNAVVEAMACGLPIVVSPVSDLPLIVDSANNGVVCESPQAEAIAAGMHRMLELSEEQRLAMGDRSRVLALNWFSSDRFFDEYEALYSQLDGPS